MITLTDPTTRPAMPGRTHLTMITPTCTEAVSRDVMRAALVKGAPFLRCSIGRQAAENFAESRAGLGLHPIGNATGSRDAP
jgi:hypothetical protein